MLGVALLTIASQARESQSWTIGMKNDQFTKSFKYTEDWRIEINVKLDQ
jgi:hypothetical protein